jgi:hypothetical protein
MIHNHFSPAKLVALAIVTIVGAMNISDAEARGGRGGGGGMRGGGGGARTSVSRPSGGYGGGASRSAGSYNRSNVNRSNYSSNRSYNRNVNVNRDVNVHGDYGYYRGGSYYRGAPIARGVAAGVAYGVTAAAIGSVAYSLPSGCGSVYYGGSPYYNCGGTYYRPQYRGSDVTYVVVNDPG